MSFKEAIRAEYARRQAANAANATLLKALPDNPERGSYYWWARLARENTGQHLLDSGVAYGYAYNRPVLPENTMCYLSIYKGEPERVSINTIAWLREATDTCDPVAVALKKVFYHIAAWPTHRDKSWFWCLDNFASDLLEFLADPHPGVLAPEELGLLNDVAGGFITHDDNTCNYDTDLDQDFNYTLFSTGHDVYDDTWGALCIHTGCDIRGGYGRPVFAKIDPERFYERQILYHCCSCNADFGNCYQFADSWNGGETGEQDCVVHLNGYPAPPELTGDVDATIATLTCPSCWAQGVVFDLLW